MFTRPHRARSPYLALAWRGLGALVLYELVRRIVPSSVVTIAWLVLLAWLAGSLLHRPTRKRLVSWLARLRFRARLAKVLGRVAHEPLASHPPLVAALSHSTSATKVDLLMPVGSSAEDLERLRPRLAAAYRVREVTITRHEHDAAMVRMTLRRRDPLAGPSTRWSFSTERRWAFEEAVPLGLDESGGLVTCGLVEHHLLLGGEPGGGKSNALSLVVAAAALDPTVRLSLFDGKLVELAAWRACAHAFVGAEIDEGIAVLEGLRDELTERYRLLESLHKRKVERADGLGYLVAVFDELAYYLNHPDKKAAQRFGELLRDLVARGRAAGLVVVAATQKPSTDVVSSSLRDLFGYRWALRCATRDASDTILGAGWAALGYSASEIDASMRGVGWLRHEGGQPVKLRAFHLDDDRLAQVAAAAAAIRAEDRLVER